MAGRQQWPRLAIRFGRALQLGASNSSSCAQTCPSFSLPTLHTPFSRAATHLRHYADLPPHTFMSMPSLSPTMTQGNIAAWKKKEGDEIAPGHVLAEIETDKATMDWEAQEEGFLAKILKSAGSKDVPVGENVAIIVEDADAVAAFKDFKEGAAPASKPAASKPAAAPSPPPPVKPPAAGKSSKSGSQAAAPKAKLPPHTVLTMPALSPTMSQGNITQWQKKVGDPVAPGDIYCDVETDKATMAWESQEEGFIAKILLDNGAKDVPLGTPALILVDEKESVDAFKDYNAKDVPRDVEQRLEDHEAGSTSHAEPPQPGPAEHRQPHHEVPSRPAAQAGKAATQGDRVRASPYAKKLAADANISLEGITGTGPDGRIVAEDVHKAIKSGKAPAAVADKSAAPKAAPAAAAAPAGADYVDIPHTQIRRITAQRLLESKQTVPHYYLTVECHVENMLKLRQQINAQAEKSGVKISVNDFVIKAASLALKKVPGVNSAWHSDFIRQYNNVDISVAVQTPTGLITPIVKDSDKKGLASISADVKALAAKAKAGKLQPAEFIGGTFTISNLGMYGVKQFAAIINPPQAAILAVGTSDKKVVMGSSGSYEEVTTMFVTLSCDHRVVDGAMGAEWLQAFKSYIENPYTMLL